MTKANLALSNTADGSLALSGELTRFSVVKNSVQQEVLASQAPLVTLDLTEIGHVDTAGLAWLIDTQATLKQRNQQLKLNQAPEQLQKLMQLGQVDKLFE